MSDEWLWLFSVRLLFLCVDLFIFSSDRVLGSMLFLFWSYRVCKKWINIENDDCVKLNRKLF